MEFTYDEYGEELCCLWNGTAYTKYEEMVAAKIRLMDDEINKSFAIRHYEVFYGKPFPMESCIVFELNLDTAFLSSTQIAAGAEFVLMNPRLSRKSILPLL